MKLPFSNYSVVKTLSETCSYESNSSLKHLVIVSSSSENNFNIPSSRRNIFTINIHAIFRYIYTLFLVSPFSSTLFHKTLSTVLNNLTHELPKLSMNFQKNLLQLIFGIFPISYKSPSQKNDLFQSAPPQPKKKRKLRLFQSYLLQVFALHFVFSDIFRKPPPNPKKR